MAYKKTYYLLLFTLPIILMICIGYWTSGEGFVSWVRIDSETGVFDMRNVDFRNTIAGTTRTVEYIPDELLTPQEFAVRDDIRVGRVPSETKVSTMRVRYMMPEDTIYGITGYSVNYASSVYINGKWIFDEGNPALNSEDERNSESFRLFSAQPADGVIEIVIASSCFVRSGSSSGMDWYVGEYENIRVHHTRMIAQDIIVMSFYISLALMSLLLFFVLPEFKATGWLCLLALVWALRTGLKSEKMLLTFFPNHNWDFVAKTEIMTSPLTIIFLTLILHSVFAEILPKFLRIVLIGGSATAALAVILLPLRKFQGYSFWSNPIIYWSLAVMLGFILFSIRRTKPTPSQIIILVGMGLVVAAFMWDEDYFGPNNVSIAITQPMMLVFTLFMLVATLLATVQKTVHHEVQLAQKLEAQGRELLEARIDIMLSQIQPHFLYNTLNTIENLCRKDGQQAASMVSSFSSYLRDNMDSLKQKELVPFTRELDHIKVYLDIEKMRFKERLNVVFNLETTDFFIPILTIQPLVENAVRHGVTKKFTGGTVIISTRREPDGIQITVADDGVGFDQNADCKLSAKDGYSHVGIENVRNRLAIQCSATLNIESVKDMGTTATVIIPGKEQ